MRVSTAQAFQQQLFAMQNRQNQLLHAEMQITSGLRVMKPSDDPSAAVQILNLDSNIAVLDQFTRNAGLAESALAQEESTLKSISDGIQRIRELAVQAANATYSEDDRHSIALEIRQREQELLALANTRDAAGAYIFAGFRNTAPPFVPENGALSYQGDEGQRFLPIGEGTLVPVSDSGQRVFQEIRDVDGQNTDLFAIAAGIAEALEGPSTSEAERAGFHAAMDRGLGNLDQALAHFGNLRAGIGARLNNIDAMREMNEDFTLQLDTVLSQTRDLDYAEAISRFNLQLTSLQAAQQVFVKTSSLSLFQYL